MKKYYGGAFDIDPYSFWTRDDIDEFVSQLEDTTFCKSLPDLMIKRGYIEDDSRIELDISYCECDETIAIPINMRKIKAPSDLFKAHVAKVQEALAQKVAQIDAELEYTR